MIPSPSQRHILSAQHFSKSDVENLISIATYFRSVFTVPVPDDRYEMSNLLNNKTVILGFFENSTRTRCSFEIAARNLGANVVNLNAQHSSISKGESLFDTLQTIDMMSPDVFVIRHQSSGTADFAARNISASVINAGDGKHEHPTQALLDVMTLYDIFPTLEGKTIGIVGDVLHSRVARSNFTLLKTMGAKVQILGPRTLLPNEIPEQWNVTVCDTLTALLDTSDAVITLRLQHERMAHGLLPSLAEYSSLFGITKQKLQESAKPTIPLLHPGPVNYGVELDFDIANSTQSFIRNQVHNGVYMRMALLCFVNNVVVQKKS